MFVMRCTDKLLAHLDVGVGSVPEKSRSKLGEWFGDIFHLRRKDYFLFLSSLAFIPVIVPLSAGINLDAIFSRLEKFLTDSGVKLDEALSDTIREVGSSEILYARDNTPAILKILKETVDLVRALSNPKGSGYAPDSYELHEKLWEDPMRIFKDSRSVYSTLLFDLYEVRLKQIKANKDRISGKRKRKPVGDLATVLIKRFNNIRQIRKSGKVDSIEPIIRILMRIRKPEVEWYSAFLDVLFATYDPGGDLAWIAMYEPREELSILACRLLCGADENQLLPEEVRAHIRLGAMLILEEGMYNPMISDQRKMRLQPCMLRLADDVPDDEYRSCFNDFDEAERSLKREEAFSSGVPDNFRVLP